MEHTQLSCDKNGVYEYNQRKYKPRNGEHNQHWVSCCMRNIFCCSSGKPYRNFTDVCFYPVVINYHLRWARYKRLFCAVGIIIFAWINNLVVSVFKLYERYFVVAVNNRTCVSLKSGEFIKFLNIFCDFYTFNGKCFCEYFAESSINFGNFLLDICYGKNSQTHNQHGADYQTQKY